MRTGKTSAATLGLVGGLALGVWIGSEMNRPQVVTPEPAAVTAQVDEPVASTPKPRPRRVIPASRAAAVVEAPTTDSTPKLVMTLPVSAPELHQRMKPVLARGTKLPLAVEGFTSAEEFAAVAHAARNTEVPFALLKHRILAEGQSLEDAILASRPNIDARTEALKAKGAARADILSLSSN